MLTARRRSSASAYSRRAATSSTSVASRRSIVRPELRWSASRTSSRRSYGSLTPAVRAVGQPGGGERAQHDHVAEAASGLLQVGLQQVGGVAERLVPLLQGREQLGQPLAGVPPPGGQQGRCARRGRARCPRPAPAGRAARPRRSARDRPRPRTRPGCEPSGPAAPSCPTAGTTATRPGRRSGPGPCRRAAGRGRCRSADRARVEPGCPPRPVRPRSRGRRLRRTARRAPPRCTRSSNADDPAQTWKTTWTGSRR